MTRSFLIKTAATIVFLGVWEGICRAGWVNPIILAPPSAIVAALYSSGWQFLDAFQLTILCIVFAAALAWLIGIGFGLLVGLSPLGYGIFSPLLTGVFAIPLITLYPLFLVWFGIGPGSKIAFAVLSGSIPIALNTMDGVRLIDRGYIKLARSIGASPLQAYLRIYFPLSLPAILSGLRIGTSLVVISVVVCEMLASVNGLGFWISYNRTLFNTGHVYLGITLAMACVMLVNFGLGHIERRYAALGEARPAKAARV
ncbi:MAG TPA: ABC transporter permease [Pseudolabrys sp.]|nr:ABC transporter permease [Pseudolabrys sp.]